MVNIVHQYVNKYEYEAECGQADKSRRLAVALCIE